jgi:hypothetical protein
MRSVIVAVILALSASSFAADKAPPSKVSREDMLDLENVALKLEALQRQAEQLVAHRDELLNRYGLTWPELGKSAGIAADGTIQRAAKENKK